MEYGKFNSAEELLKGYNELEKSFTQKCQQLAELQKKQLTGGTNETSSPPDNPKEESAAIEEQTVCAVPADVSLSSAANGGSNPDPQDAPLPKVMAGGGNVSLVLPTKPKTIKEASALARQLFEGL